MAGKGSLHWDDQESHGRDTVVVRKDQQAECRGPIQRAYMARPGLQESFWYGKNQAAVIYPAFQCGSQQTLRPLALMESAPVCPDHYVDFRRSAEPMLVSGFTPAGVAFPAIPSCHSSQLPETNPPVFFYISLMGIGLSINGPAHGLSGTLPGAPAAPRRCVPCGWPGPPWQRSCGAGPSDGAAIDFAYPACCLPAG